MRIFVGFMLCLFALLLFAAPQQVVVAEETSNQAAADAAALAAYAELLQPRMPVPPLNRPVMAVSVPLQYSPPAVPKLQTKPKQQTCGPNGCSTSKGGSKTYYRMRGGRRANRWR